MCHYLCPRFPTNSTGIASGTHTLYEGDGNMITVPAGWFTVFFPEDGHKPCAAVNDRPSPVRKVVVKIAVGS
ncbi:MAG: YhcH/YjgK/YiaL family protein [Planctomyces sp.]